MHSSEQALEHIWNTTLAAAQSGREKIHLQISFSTEESLQESQTKMYCSLKTKVALI